MNNGANPREIALRAINSILKNGAYSTLEMKELLEKSRLDSKDRKFASNIVYGTVRNKLLLDFIIARYSNIKAEKMSPSVNNVLRSGIFQLLFMRVPVSAACNESVNLVKKMGNKGAAGFVNAILRKIAREIEGFKVEAEIKGKEVRFKEQVKEVRFGEPGKDYKVKGSEKEVRISESEKEVNENDEMQNFILSLIPDKNSDNTGYLSVLYSFPIWMVEKFKDTFGETQCESFLMASNKPPALNIRVNTLKTDRVSLAGVFEKKGIGAYPLKLACEGMELETISNPAYMEEYSRGLFSIQDEGAMLVASMSGVKPGLTVIDLCSAPGGKTTHMAQLMENKGRIIAFDINQSRLKLVEEACSRLGVTIVETLARDTLEYMEQLCNHADIVLLDAPCSGLGIIRRKPDIKWNRTKEDITVLAEIQSKMLEVAKMYVKPGGNLVYSTCTVCPEENEFNIRKFLDCNREFTLLFEKQLLPHVDATDGFYIAGMRKLILPSSAEECPLTF